MSINPVSSRNSIDGLAQQLHEVFDSNRDGRLTAAEFENVLQRFMPDPQSVDRSGSSPVGSTAPLAGFDLNQIATSSSPKYRFARAAMRHSLSDVHDSKSAQALLERMRPTFRAEGLEVLDIRNDRLRVRAEGREVWVDVIRGAGSGEITAFQWLPE